MSNALFVRSEASQDIRRAFAWYEQKNQGLGLEFLRSVDACMAGIARNPFAFPIAHQEIRRSVLRKFPYPVFYVPEAERVVVLACLHHRRNPTEWMERGDI